MAVLDPDIHIDQKDPNPVAMKVNKMNTFFI